MATTKTKKSAKKEPSKRDILTSYMEYVLENGKQPPSVFAFSKSNKMDESQFYNHFGSFKSLEKGIYEEFFNMAMALLKKDKSYNNFDSQNKLLSFYYTFFEILKQNRSYVLKSLDDSGRINKQIEILEGLRFKFEEYVKELDIDTLDLKNKDANTLQKNLLSKAAWTQMLITLKFWLEDDSVNFEKTDVLIEKSVTTSFELINLQPIRSVLDLGKFLYKEKFKSQS
ncbi:TetR family transcriptional regulator C-terminal domain-containing protein [Aegicerativicinus sediminis]|uniref:TetR family transcriptional regulator C-terminal domain-containing protein n=1 Tax=Aegicerativicinus sediminis TaxID=2893202 RepID=UPI001E31BAD0|nr:TetR family transcriptional regulator C-terminal domain-containing protein [Aegicerativicinus sediminis]